MFKQRTIIIVMLILMRNRVACSVVSHTDQMSCDCLILKFCISIVIGNSVSSLERSLRLRSPTSEAHHAKRATNALKYKMGGMFLQGGGRLDSDKLYLIYLRKKFEMWNSVVQALGPVLQAGSGGEIVWHLFLLLDSILAKICNDYNKYLSRH